MSKIFRLSILIILLLLLSMTGCVNDLKSAQGQPETTNPNIDEPQGQQETINPSIDEPQGQPETENPNIYEQLRQPENPSFDEQQVQPEKWRIRVAQRQQENPNIYEPIDNVSEFLEDIGKSYETLRKEHPDAELTIYGSFPDDTRDDAVTIPEDIGIDAALLTLRDPGASYAYCLFLTQGLELLRIPVEFFDQIRCQGITTTVGFLFPQVSDAMPIQDFFSMINVVEYEDLFYLEDCFSGWLQFEYKGMGAYMSARSDGDIEGPLLTIKSTYRITLEKGNIAGKNMDVISDYADFLNSLM